MKKFIFSLLFIILIGLSGLMQFLYDQNIDYFREKDVFLALPRGKTLQILSFGYSEVTADFLYLWAIQFYSNYTLKNSSLYIEDVFDLITDISPNYRDPYITGSVIMMLEMGKAKMAIRLLQKGSKNHPDEWIFDFDSGYYASKYLKDYKLAGKYFKKAAKVKNVPKFIQRMYFHQVYMENNLRLAWELWKEVRENANTNIEKDSADKHLYQIKYEMDSQKIERSAIAYKKRYGFFPNSLKILYRSGFIDLIPKDFKGNSYIYDSGSGKIRSKEKFSWKK